MWARRIVLGNFCNRFAILSRGAAPAPPPTLGFVGYKPGCSLVFIYVFMYNGGVYTIIDGFFTHT
jgi:hypothetical protein